VFVGDKRISRCTVTVDGTRLVALAAQSLPRGWPGSSTRRRGSTTALIVEQVRDLRADGAVETITVTSTV
jgi:hypothetical protein